MKYIKKYELFGGAKITKALKDDTIISMKQYNELLTSIYRGNFEKFQKLLNSNIDLEYEDADGNTALLLATRYRDLKMVKEIIKKGANIYHKNKSGEDFYDIAKFVDKITIKKTFPLKIHLPINTSSIKEWIEYRYPEFVDAKKYNL
jgi:ankyrin repeat protein